jgi:hypothetical protein
VVDELFEHRPVEWLVDGDDEDRIGVVGEGGGPRQSSSALWSSPIRLDAPAAVTIAVI